MPGWTRASEATARSEACTYFLIARFAAACVAGSSVVLIVRPPRLSISRRARAVLPKSGLLRISCRTYRQKYGCALDSQPPGIFVPL
ncbi:hypothetical protein GCM10020219_028690 [Nonomuraea dietziae]